MCHCQHCYRNLQLRLISPSLPHAGTTERMLSLHLSPGCERLRHSNFFYFYLFSFLAVSQRSRTRTLHNHHSIIFVVYQIKLQKLQHSNSHEEKKLILHYLSLANKQTPPNFATVILQLSTCYFQHERNPLIKNKDTNQANNSNN